jgi:hypothetical protein
MSTRRFPSTLEKSSHEIPLHHGLVLSIRPSGLEDRHPLERPHELDGLIGGTIVQEDDVLHAQHLVMLDKGPDVQGAIPNHAERDQL